MIVRQSLVVCDHCDTVHRWHPLARAEVARRYSLEHIGPQFVAVLQEVAARDRR